MKKDNTILGSERDENAPYNVYILFNAKTGSTKTFVSETQLMKEAEKVGYKGKKELMSLSTYYYKL